MIFGWTNIISLFVLAFSGAAMVVCARRLMRVIREVERRLSRTVDEKNMVAAALRHARKEEAALRDAVLEADQHVAQMSGKITATEMRIDRLRGQKPRQVTMLDREWNRFERLWSVTVTNPSLAAGWNGSSVWNEGKSLYGFARSGDDLYRRVAQEYPPAEGFVISAPVIIDLADDGGGSVAVDHDNGIA